MLWYQALIYMWSNAANVGTIVLRLAFLRSQFLPLIDRNKCMYAWQSANMNFDQND